MRSFVQATCVSAVMWFAPCVAMAQTPAAPPPATATPALPPPPAATPAQVAPMPPPPAATARPVTTPGWTAPLPPATTPHPRRPALMRERLRLLNGTLIPLSERSHDSRVSQGWLNIGVGASLVALGFLFSGGSDSPQPFQALMWFQGGYTVAGGLIDLVWTPARERLSEQYARMPMTTRDHRRDRVHFGEQSLDEMAREGSRRRLLGAIGSFTLAAGTAVVLYRDQIFNGAPLPEPAAYNYLVLGLLGVSLIPTIVSAFSRSEEERLRDSYHREVEMMRQIQADEAQQSTAAPE